MKIKLTTTVPVAKKHNLEEGRILDVLREEDDVGGRGRSGYWVQGADEEVLILFRECEVIET